MQPIIFDLELGEIKQWLKNVGEPTFRAGQIFDWLYVKRVSSFEEMSNLSKSLRLKLTKTFVIEPLRTITMQQSKDGTIKFLFGLYDDHAIETVIMKHKYGNSVCVTTQVGCRIGCTFCASTIGGLKRNLNTGEIVAQVVEAQKVLDEKEERVSSIVIMGSGEPFENFDAMLSFLKIVNDDDGLNIGQRHITVSTSGIVPQVYQFAEAGLQINLAISLHAPNDELRSKLMPVNRRFPLRDLLEACKYYIETTNRRITFEYALMGGVNDQPEHAEELARIMHEILEHIHLIHFNLIPVNPVMERNYIRTERNEIFEFARILEKHRINTTIRREHGVDIAAACGQLRAQHMEKKEIDTEK
ncbi:MAG: 23S rRNA (adenine(2503)-C(2))-methyltransferase RlmN [Bacilli bacterium]